MEFKKLEIKPEGSWVKRVLLSAHGKKTMLYIALGAVAGFAYFYFTDGKQMEQMPTNEILRSVFTGGFFGFFLTNSPCARNQC